MTRRRVHAGTVLAVRDTLSRNSSLISIRYHDAMPNVHVRDVPLEALETLREAAKRHGRSLNAELVDALVQRGELEARSATLVQRLEAHRRRIAEAHPDGLPPELEPEAVIRRLRDGA